MNLVLDFGNTRIKAAIFSRDALVEKHIFNSEAELLSAIHFFQNIQHCLVASVTNNHDTIAKMLSKKFHTLVFKADTPIPLKNLYKSSATLGSDRIAASVGAYTLFPNQNTLTIDAGTCIKYNFVNHHNEYYGGAISPGIPMRLKAMNYYTQRLPLVEFDMNYQTLIGKTTEQSILSGALIGAALEVDGMISEYLSEYPDLQVVLTGGDAEYLCKQVKSRFFADQNILLQGLNTILNFNIEK